MKRLWVTLSVIIALGVFSFSATPQANAALRVGADVLWYPISFETMMENGAHELDSDRNFASYGVSGHANLGFDIFSVGLKLNFSQHAFSNEDLNYSELDVNLMLRSGLPILDFAVFAEVGPSVAFDYGGFGYNAAVGVEYDILPLPLLDLNVGLAGQYVNMPVGSEYTRDIDSVRIMLFVGIDFSI